MDFRIDKRVEDHLTAPDADEYQTLKEKIKREGCYAGALKVGTVEELGNANVLADGHTSLRICKDLRIKHSEPVHIGTFKTLADLLVWVAENQFGRRNAGISWKEQQRERRKKKVQELKNSGLSTRQIADQEGLSQSTVTRDLNREVSKNAGESHDDSKNTSEVENTPPKAKIYCAGCTTRLRKNQSLPGKCPDCKELRAAARANKKGGNQDADTPEPAPKGPPMDDLGNEIPKSLRDVFSGNRETLSQLRKLIGECRRVLKGLGDLNPFLLEHKSQEYLKTVSENIKNAIPYCLCPDCESKGCDTCRKSGWLTKWKHESLELAAK